MAFLGQNRVLCKVFSGKGPKFEPTRGDWRKPRQVRIFIVQNSMIAQILRTEIPVTPTVFPSGGLQMIWWENPE